MERGIQNMKKVAMLVCKNAVGNKCTGSGCMRAFNNKTGTFERYSQEELELQAFFNATDVKKV